jgi:mitogen-activated protein kinase organizer 1
MPAAEPPPSLPGQASVTLRAHAGAVSAALFNARGAYVVTAGADRAVRLFSARAALDADAAGAAPTQLTTPIKSYAAPASHAPLALALAASDAQLAHGGGDRNVSLVDVASGAVLRRFNAHSGAVHALAFAGPGDALLLAAGFDVRVRAYDLRAQNAWKPVMEMREGRDTILALAVRGAALWAAGKEGVVRGYDVRMGELTEDVIGGECS